MEVKERKQTKESGYCEGLNKIGRSRKGREGREKS